jgi:tRNA modification GTPase TrmE
LNTQSDTIAAPATASGRGGIGIIRISGPDAASVLRAVFQPRTATPMRPWTLHRGYAVDAAGLRLDDVLAVLMPGPRSFTGEDVVEVHCHGSPALLGLILESVLHAGARLAERGEFSRRAFMNGRMDLSQAEAVAELIAAPGPEAARWASARLEGLLASRIRTLREQVDALRASVCLAVDFPDDEVESDLSPQGFQHVAAILAEGLDDLITAYDRTRPWREGLSVALAGPVNAGKSSLLNAVLGRERALVSDAPGTTRDYLEEQVRFGGLPVRLLDTAGLRLLAEDDGPQERLEARGMELGKRMAGQADVVIVLVDGVQPDKALTESLLADFGPERVVLAWNKRDCRMPDPWFTEPPFTRARRVAIAAKTGLGLEELFAAVADAVHAGGTAEPETDLLVPNLRQTEALRQARSELEALCDDVAAMVPWDLCAVRLDALAGALEEVTGTSTPDDILNSIFASFCIGK